MRVFAAVIGAAALATAGAALAVGPPQPPTPSGTGTTATTPVARATGLYGYVTRGPLAPLCRPGESCFRPALAGTRLDVAQVIETIKAAESRGEEAIQEAADYLGIQPAYVLACVTYYADYKDEVDKWREHEHAVSRRAQEAWARGRAVLS